MEKKSVFSSLNYMFNDPKFKTKYAVLTVLCIFSMIVNIFGNNQNSQMYMLIGLILFIPSLIASILLNGYLCAGIKALSEQESNYVLPFFNFKLNFVSGFKLIVATILFLIPFCLIFGIVGAVFHLPLITILGGLFLFIFYMAFFRNFAMTQSILAFFQFKKIFASVKENCAEYFKSIGVLVLVTLAACILIILVAMLSRLFGALVSGIVALIICSMLVAYVNMCFIYLTAKYEKKN